MLAKNIVEPTPPVAIDKMKDGTLRFCVDCRRLKSLPCSEATPMPAIAEAFPDFVFSTIDLKSGYWQIPEEKASGHLKNFATPEGATY